MVERNPVDKIPSDLNNSLEIFPEQDMMNLKQKYFFCKQNSLN